MMIYQGPRPRTLIRSRLLVLIWLLSGAACSKSGGGGAGAVSEARQDSPSGLYAWEGLGPLSFNSWHNRWEQAWIRLRYWFLADGRVITNALGDGALIDGYDVESAIAQGAKVSRWTLSGETLTLTDQDGDAVTLAFDGYRIEVGARVLGNDMRASMVRPERVSDLPGTYYKTNGIWVDAETSLSTERVLVFRADGSATIRDAYFFASDIAAASEQSGAQATWQLDGFTLTITPEGHPTERKNLWRYGSDGAIVIGSTLYLREADAPSASEAERLTVRDVVQGIVEAVCRKAPECGEPVAVETCAEQYTEEQCRQVDCQAPFDGTRAAIDACASAIGAMSCEALARSEFPAECGGSE